MNDDGGPAFPVTSYDNQTFSPKTVDELRRLLSGMSLRDYFASAAIQSIPGRDWSFLKSDDEKIEAWAKAAYVVADAMLKKRAEGKT